MIISRTPFRVSFVGGGTDLKSFYQHEDGCVISTAIDKYVYVMVKRQIGIVEYKYRVNWSRTEFRENIDDIEHPIVREALRLFKIDYSVEISIFSDIPAGTGMGSSSSLAVGLVHALFALKGEMATKYQIATLAARIEIDILGRHIGKQDHFASAYGGLNEITFRKDESVLIEPLICQQDAVRRFESSLMLFYTETTRDASDVLQAQYENPSNHHKILFQIKTLVHEFKKSLYSSGGLLEMGSLIDKNWLLKKQLSKYVSNEMIDAKYQSAMLHNAIGAKLLGAGSGGFLLVVARSEDQDRIAKAMNLYQLPFKFDSSGTRITYFDQTSV